LMATAAEQIVVPVAVNDATASNVVSMMPMRKRFVRRVVMPGAAAAAAIVAVVLVTGQQQTATLASAPVGATVATAVVPSAITTVASTSSAPQGAASIGSLAQQGEVARDPRIDDYLLAHQRFSPSMYSSTQYARSAAFAIDSDK